MWVYGHTAVPHHLHIVMPAFTLHGLLPLGQMVVALAEIGNEGEVEHSFRWREKRGQVRFGVSEVPGGTGSWLYGSQKRVLRERTAGDAVGGDGIRSWNVGAGGVARRKGSRKESGDSTILRPLAASFQVSDLRADPLVGAWAAEADSAVLLRGVSGPPQLHRLLGPQDACGGAGEGDRIQKTTLGTMPAAHSRLSAMLRDLCLRQDPLPWGNWD